MDVSGSPDIGAQIAAAMAAVLSDAMPNTESKTGTPGSAPKATREGHSHPRQTSSTTGTTDVNGGATVVFTRTFAAPPSVAVFAVEDNTNPSPDFKVRAWTTDGAGAITGCTIYGSRAKPLPTLGALLTSVISSLSGFAPYEPAGNVAFTIIAVQTSAG